MPCLELIDWRISGNELRGLIYLIIYGSQVFKMDMVVMSIVIHLYRIGSAVSGNYVSRKVMKR